MAAMKRRRMVVGRLVAAAGLAAGAVTAEVVRVGAGGYLDALPAGAKGPPGQIHRTADRPGPMPACDWWTSLAWTPLSDAMYPHPLALRAEAGGLRVCDPGPRITAHDAAIAGSMPGGGEDLVLGHSAAGPFTAALAADWSDWFVTAQFGAADLGFRATFGHGSPYVFAEFRGGEPVLTFPRPPEVFAGGEREAALGLRAGRSCYGLFAPAGSTWSGAGSARLQAGMNGKTYFSIALLPDDRPETFALFRRHAFAFVTNSRVAWRYDEAKAAVHSTFTLDTQCREGAETATLFALYPHQWRGAKAVFTGHAYASVRGPMKLASGTAFAVETPLPGSLPALPLTDATDRAKLRELIAGDLAGPARLTGDTYWLGKQLGRWATLLPLAEQAGDAAAATGCAARLRGALENFFTPTNAAGRPKGPGEGVFARDPVWGTLIGYPASYGSDDQLNDHHFHYGYFIRAAAELARVDPAWAADAQWGGMVKLLIRDIASPDRRDPLFPFLRCFDPYAGHSWASGHAKFGDGNNNESSSEAVNAWHGLMLWGEVTGDTALRDLGAWLYATEIAAIEDYWFDVRDELFPAAYTPSVVTMVWGGKGANATWFSSNPECVHGINWLPFTGGSFYLGRWPDYAPRNYAAMVRENLAADMKAAAKKNVAPPADGTRWDQWADIVWMYRALSDPRDAMRQFEARPAGFKPEAGNALAGAYAWIAALGALGAVDRTVTADAPFAVVFSREGRRTHVAWNAGGAARTVRFSDGVELSCPPRGGAMR